MQTLASAEDVLYQHWKVPDKPIEIYLSRAVAAAILLEVKPGLFERRRPEIGGILLGKVTVRDTTTVRIEACVELQCEHLFGPSYSMSEDEKQALRNALAKYDPDAEDENCAVGYFRTHSRRGLGLTADDLQLAEFFPQGKDLVLLLKPRLLLPNRAAFFFWGDAQSQPETPAIAFSTPRHAGRDSALQAAADPAKPALTQPAVPRVRAPRKLHWWSWWVQAPLRAFLVLAWYLIGFSVGRQIDKVVPRPAPPPRDPYALSLMVVQFGDNLHLTWDRQSMPIAAAQRGDLVIFDGGQSRTLRLTAEQLRTGTVAYHRLSDRVEFRLEVILPGRRTVSETWESSATAQ